MADFLQNEAIERVESELRSLQSGFRERLGPELELRWCWAALVLAKGWDDLGGATLD